MIKYIIFFALFVILVFFLINSWEKLNKATKKNLIISFLALILVSMSLLTYLLFD
tara:strand:- start:310 stop:474 length:165 start_codon:yes stop_codon:yes gene_type:complete